MLQWVLRAIQGPSFGQTRRSGLQEIIDAFEANRASDELPLSRKMQQEEHEYIVAKRDSLARQNHQG